MQSENQPWQIKMFRRSIKKQQKLKALLELLGETKGKKCLLVTCGDNNGALNWYFREHGGEWTWADVSGENNEQISQLLNEPVYAFKEDDFQIPAEQFDCVVSIDVLEHLQQDQPFLAELKRVLKPGGRAVVTVPNGDDRLLANQIKWKLGMTPEIYGHTRAGYTVAQLSDAIQAAGMQPQASGGYSRFATEMIELVINYGYVRVLSKKQGGAQPGHIAPVSSGELKTHGMAYKVYSLIFPVARMISRLDKIMPAKTNNAVIVTAAKPGSKTRKNVLITGAGGFIGSHLVDSQLEKGFSVRAVDLHLELLAQHAGNPRLEAVYGDITDINLVKELVDGVDIVYHLASAHLDVRLSDEHYRNVNVGATVALLEAARQAGVKRFVHCSSVGVIGDVENPPADETTECHPTNIYERTKLEGEKAALEFAHLTGFPMVVMRPAWVYGPRCPRTAKLMRMIKKGRYLFFGKGQNMRHPVYISDAVEGLELCACTDGINGEVFIIAGEKPVQVSELVNTISDVMGVRAPKIHLPMSLGWLAGYALEIAFKLLNKQPPLSRRSLDFFRKHNAYRIGKAERMLGYHPCVDLRTGMQKTIQWNH